MIYWVGLRGLSCQSVAVMARSATEDRTNDVVSDSTIAVTVRASRSAKAKRLSQRTAPRVTLAGRLRWTGGAAVDGKTAVSVPRSRWMEGHRKRRRCVVFSNASLIARADGKRSAGSRLKARVTTLEREGAMLGLTSRGQGKTKGWAVGSSPVRTS
jgi:hypothetical protein